MELYSINYSKDSLKKTSASKEIVIEQALKKLEQLMAQNKDVLIRLKER